MPRPARPDGRSTASEATPGLPSLAAPTGDRCPAPAAGTVVSVVRAYQSERNERWEGFEHRTGDIVVSTRSKCGTTWMQMICLLLVHQTTPLPASLAELSPWLDWDVEPIEAVCERLAGQDHRRVIKTHTPLDGIPLDDRVMYVVVARHPLDVAVSLFHHARNIDRERLVELSGKPAVAGSALHMSEEAWMDHWLSDRTDPLVQLDTLPGNLHHVADAWGHAGFEDNVILVHYEDLEADLAGSMRRLAGRLDLEVPEHRWTALVDAATFDAMRRDAARSVPDRLGVVRDAERFFRSGRSGDGRRACTADQLRRYEARAADLAEPDVLAWLHRTGARSTA